MSKGMLGNLLLSDTQGPRDDFEKKLAGEDGEMWLDAFKRFLRKENPWESMAKKKEKKKKIKSLILVPKPFNQAEFLREKWTIWKGPVDGNGLEGEEDIDSRSLELTKIDVSKMIFETCLEENETSITGEEKYRRFKEKTDFVRYGANIFMALLLDYKAKGKNSALEWLYKNKRINYLDFFGIIFCSPGGHRVVLYLARCRRGGWGWDCRWLVDGWCRGNLSAGSAS